MLSSDEEIVNLKQYEKEIRVKPLKKSCHNTYMYLSIEVKF